MAVDAETAKGFNTVSFIPTPTIQAQSSLTDEPLRIDLGRYHSCKSNTCGDAPTPSMSGRPQTDLQTNNSSSMMAPPTPMARSTSGTP